MVVLLIFDVNGTVRPAGAIVTVVLLGFCATPAVANSFELITSEALRFKNVLCDGFANRVVVCDTL